jgi:hypothetical protein
MFKIETYNPLSDSWTHDALMLGHGCIQGDNLWNTEVEALAACDEMASTCGFCRDSLRVAPID